MKHKISAIKCIWRITNNLASMVMIRRKLKVKQSKVSLELMISKPEATSQDKILFKLLIMLIHMMVCKLRRKCVLRLGIEIK